MLKFVPDHLKTKTIWRYVPDQYKTQQMCNKTILENGGTSESVSNCYKNQEIWNKAVDNYPHALEFLPDYYMTQEMCNKIFNTHSSTIRYKKI